MFKMPGGERPPPVLHSLAGLSQRHLVDLRSFRSQFSRYLRTSILGGAARSTGKQLGDYKFCDGSFDLELNMLSLFLSKEGTTSPGQFNGSPESQDGRMMRKLRHVELYIAFDC